MVFEQTNASAGGIDRRDCDRREPAIGMARTGRHRPSYRETGLSILGGEGVPEGSELEHRHYKAFTGVT